MTTLRSAGVRGLLAAQWTSKAGDCIALVALPFAVFALGGSAIQVALALAARIASLVVLVLAGGVLADRLDRRTVMIAADLLRFAAQGTIAVLLICGAASYWQLIVAQVLSGAGSAFFFPAMSGLLPELVGPVERQDANALSGLAGSSAEMLGFALAGAAVAAIAPGGALALDALTFAASAALLWRIGPPAPPRREEGGASFLAQLVEGWTEFRRLTWLWVVVLEFAALNALAFGPFEVLGPLVAQRSLGGAGAWALILAGSGVGALAGGIAALRCPAPRRPLLVATSLVACWAPPLALLAGGAPATLIAVAAIPAGAALAIFEALWLTTFQDNVSHEQLSRIAAYDWLGSFAMLPLGYLLAATTEATLGVGPTLWGAAGIVVVATVVVTALPCVRGLRSRRARPQASLGPPAGSVATR